MTNNKLTEIPVTESDIQTVLDAFDYRTGIDSHAEYIVRCALTELQERRKADNAEPIYQIKGERGGEWHDFSKLSFDEFVSFGGEGRILYTAHPVPVLPLSITLPDTSSKAFWSCTGKKEVFHPETYKRWAKKAIERFCMIAGIAVEVK